MKTIANKKAVMYARVSSDRQEREGYSIPAQIKLNKEYARKHNLNIVAEFIEPETAKKSGRTKFNEMLKFLKKNTTVRAIIVEKTDRIYRNFKDYVTLDEFQGLEIHFSKTNTIISENSTSQQKFIHAINVIMAKNYIDNLSEEIKKGLKEKAEQGFCPTKAPFGYKNKILDSGKRIIIVDETEAPFIKKAFALYAKGNQTYVSVAKALNDDGFRPNNHKCTEKQIERILNNPFYIGRFIYQNKTYLNGQHEAIISENEYFIVQRLLRNKCDLKPRIHDFYYNGLIKCTNCGCSLTGEIKKGKYIYYHCTNAKKLDKSKPSIRQEKIEALFGDFLSQIQFTPEETAEIKQAVKDFLKQGNEYIESKTNEQKRRIDLLNKRLGKLYEDRSDGIIDDEFYFTKRDEWQNERDNLLFEFQTCAKSNENLFNIAEMLIELAKDAHGLFIEQTGKEKAELMKLLTIELLFDGSNLTITPHSAFAELMKFKKRHSMDTASEQSNFFDVQKFVNALSDNIFVTRIKEYRKIA